MAKKILLIEDIKINRELAVSTLKKNGYEIISCPTGKCGLEKALSDQPDLIITDIGLTDISGEKVVETLKSQESTKEIPVIVLSSYVELKNNFKKYDGLVFVSKPVAPKYLVTIVEKILKV